MKFEKLAILALISCAVLVGLKTSNPAAYVTLELPPTQLLPITKPASVTYAPHTVEVYTNNWNFDGAEIELRSDGKAYRKTIPAMRWHRWTYQKTDGGRISFENVTPENGFYLVVRGKNGKTIAAFSSQPFENREKPIHSFYLHICEGPHIFMNGPERSVRPIGREGDVGYDPRTWR